MEKAVYKEENGVYQIDCSAAVWSTDQIYNLYHTAGVFLKDADFVIETPEYILLVEYKNADIPGAVNPQAFKPFEEKRTIGVARKFYESLHYLAMEKKDKPVKYIYIVEYPYAGATDTKLLRNCIAEKLPFRLQQGRKAKLIEDFEVLSIAEWNSHPDYRAYPITPVKAEENH